jgi:DNA polymerase I-like protein with 3'-5' exonuclease and polymerase domains
LAVDIETVKGSQHILSVAFSPSKALGVCIVPLDEARKSAIARILASPARKIFQFGTFDYRQLTDNGYQVIDPEAQSLGRLYWWDTMVAQHVLAPELPRSLEYLTSVLTREPYYKTEGRGNIPGDTKSWSLKANKEALYVYNAKDTCCTFEVYEQQVPDIMSDVLHPDTFDFEMSMLETFDELGASGMFVDEERRQLLEDVLVARWAKRQFVLDRLTGFVTNVHSPKLANILYDKDKVGLPVRKTREGRVTTKEDAIVGLIAFCKGKLEEVVREDTILAWKVKLAICETILEIRGIRKNLSSYILAQNKKGIKRAKSDGRIHSVYKITTETARTASSKYHDGTGFNAQTLPRDPVDVPEELLDEALTLGDKRVTLVSQLDSNDDETEDVDEED